MNKKILMVATLILFAIVSIGSISAAEDIGDGVDDVLAVDDEVVLTDGEGTDPQTTTIEITTDMDEEQIQGYFLCHQELSKLSQLDAPRTLWKPSHWRSE